LSLADFKRKLIGLPLVKSPGKDFQLFTRDMRVVSQHYSGKLAVFAFAAFAINHNRPGSQAYRKHFAQMLVPMVTVKLPRSRNVTCLVMLVVTSVDKDNLPVLIIGTPEQSGDFVEFRNGKTLFLQPLNGG